MIQESIINQTLSSVCSVVKSNINHNDLPGLTRNEIIKQLTVHATGFLVENNICLTNRHVIELIEKDEPQITWYADFIKSNGDGTWTHNYRIISGTFKLNPTSTPESLDIGILELKPQTDSVEEITPIRISSDLSTIRIGKDIAMCGFGFGDALLEKLSFGRRCEPSIHQGIVSGVSPFSDVDPRNKTLILTDVRSGNGFSGSPIICTETGDAIGVHCAGNRTLLGMGHPIDKQRVDGWIEMLKFVKETVKIGKRPICSLSESGDIISLKQEH